MKKLTVVLGLLLLALWASACGDSTSPPGPSRVVVSPFTTNMAAVGETVQYTARLEDQNGAEITGTAFTWSISDSQVASISPTGLLTGLKAGTATVTASSEGISGNANLTIDPVPDAMAKVSGDGQQGILRQILPEQITVEILDANGNPVEGKVVTFSVVVGGGTATPWQAQTGADGRASTLWQLGCSNDNPQRLDATIGGLTASFTATVDVGALAICQESVPSGRETQAYSTQLAAAGGDQGSLAWSLGGGQLPPGLDLAADGRITGTPTQAGTFNFLARVQDGAGGSASSNFPLKVCDAPADLAPGESLAFDPAAGDECGFYLPAGNDGDRYRFAVVYTRSDTSSANVPTVTVELEREAGGAVGSGSLVSSRSFQSLVRPPALSPSEAAILRESVERRERTRAFHHQVREAERELLAKLGPEARPLPDRPRALQRVMGPMAAASPAKVNFTNSSDLSSCSVGENRRAILVKENDVMVVYQDSIQRASNPLPDAQAQALLDHYEAYGHQVIQSYFGGVSDIDDNGKIVVFVTPVVDDDVAAYVWSGDFFPKTTQGNFSGCAASNEMELIRFSLDVIKAVSDGNFQALGTAVHEAKHVSSLYKSLGRFDPITQTSDYYQPDWVEEGTAESAEERAARIAWALTGGPAVGDMADEDDVRALSSFTKEMYSTILVNAGAKGYLSSQPNSVVTDPVGASSIHSVYGSGWHFHRWLGDAFGNAEQALADSALSRFLNDSTTAIGVAGILAATGAPSWTALLEQYAVAIMLNGTGAPESARAFTSYNFPSFHSTFEYTSPGLEPAGDYPWPVNTAGEDATSPFQTMSNTGPIGPSGIRVFDLTSNGTGLGLLVRVSTVSGIAPFRIVLVRIE